MQGKQKEADAIRHTLLQTHKTPWDSITLEKLISLSEKGLNAEKKDKAARLLLFEYALQYQQFQFFDELAAWGF